MPKVLLAPLTADAAGPFLEAVQRSAALHKGWVEPPTTDSMFKMYASANQGEDLRFAVRNSEWQLVGIANINSIIRGAFQNGYLGFYAFEPHQGKGYMRSALAQLVTNAFLEHGLHRLEANVQPENSRSCALVERLGFRLEAFSPRYLRVAGEWRDHKRYAVTSEEWRPEPSLLGGK